MQKKAKMEAFYIIRMNSVNASDCIRLKFSWIIGNWFAASSRFPFFVILGIAFWNILIQYCFGESVFVLTYTYTHDFIFTTYSAVTTKSIEGNRLQAA